MDEGRLNVSPLDTNNLFLQDDILYHLFSVLPLRDLLKFRQVCKRWNRLSLTFVNKLSWIHLNSHRRLDEFLLLSDTSEQLLGSQFVMSEIFMDHPLTTWFFVLYGASLQSLKLCVKEDRMMSMEAFQHLLVQQVFNLNCLEISLPGSIENQSQLFTSSMMRFPTLDNLTSLRLCNAHGYNIGFLQDLFNAAPNVTRLKVLLDNQLDDMTKLPRCVVLQALESTNLYKTIKYLELESIVTEHHLQCLTMLAHSGLSLKSLVFTQIHPRYFKRDTLQDFLISQWLSLETLKLDTVPAQYYWDDTVCLTLMQMVKLKTLKVSGRYVALPASTVNLYDDKLVTRVEHRLDQVDLKLRKMKKRCVRK